MTDHDHDTTTDDTGPADAAGSSPARIVAAVYGGDTEVIMRGNGTIRNGSLVAVHARELDPDTGRRDLIPALTFDAYTKEDLADFLTRLGFPTDPSATKADLVAAADLALATINDR